MLDKVGTFEYVESQDRMMFIRSVTELSQFRKYWSTGTHSLGLWKRRRQLSHRSEGRKELENNFGFFSTA